MKTLIHLFASVALIGLAACDSPEMDAATSEAKSAAKSIVSEAVGDIGLAPGGLLTTQNACLLAGQSEVFCGCLSTELGPNLDASHIQGLTQALKTGLSGDLKGAVAGATDIDPQTRTAIAKCGTRAAISGAIGQ
jgi:hypothetical protein